MSGNRKLKDIDVEFIRVGILWKVKVDINEVYS